MAGVALAMLPIVVLFLFSQRFFIEGIALLALRSNQNDTPKERSHVRWLLAYCPVLP